MASVWTSWLTLTSIFCRAILSDAFHRERRERAFSFAQHTRFFAAEVDYRAWLDAAGARVDHEVHLVLQPGAHRFRFRQWRAVSGKQKRGREHGLIELDEQRVRHRMARHAYADRLL